MKREGEAATTFMSLTGWSHARQLFTFSEAVASLVPLASKARAANGLSWAGIMLAARWITNVTVRHTLTQTDISDGQKYEDKIYEEKSKMWGEKVDEKDPL